MTYNKQGLIYFMNIMSLNSSNYYLPKEIRIIIWDFAHIVQILQCYICNKILINFNINFSTIPYIENYSIINGIAKCNNCFID